MPNDPAQGLVEPLKDHGTKPTTKKIGVIVDDNHYYRRIAGLWVTERPWNSNVINGSLQEAGKKNRRLQRKRGNELKLGIAEHRR